jgi:carboxylesterase type B
VGSGAIYPGNSFVDIGNVVFVNINYRLGSLGFAAFLESPDGAVNFGLLDCQVALEWVSKNIRGFGGNPDMVTILGESAGSLNIAFFLQMQSTWSFYQRAIMESGASVILYDINQQINVTSNLANQ